MGGGEKSLVRVGGGQARSGWWAGLVQGLPVDHVRRAGLWVGLGWHRRLFHSWIET